MKRIFIMIIVLFLSIGLSAQTIDLSAGDEADRLALEAEMCKNCPLNFISICAYMNTAGGAELNISFENSSRKTIKYAQFYFKVFNAVNDVIPCSVNKTKTQTIKLIGPIKPGADTQQDYFGTKPVWYNDTSDHFEITKIILIYMDKSQIVISDKKKISTMSSKVGKINFE